jgi:hypothetical protein
MAWVESRCLCPTCPAYPEEDRGEKKAYCLRGDSAHKESIDPSDCYCEACEVYKHGRLYGRNYYCLEGAALARGLANLLEGRGIQRFADERNGPGPALVLPVGLDLHRRGGATRDE